MGEPNFESASMSGKSRARRPATARDPADKYLKAALIEAYAARAGIFHRGVTNSRMREMYATIDAVDASSLHWDAHELHITQKAMQSLRNKAIPLHTVFVHPDILQADPRFIAYYRNLVAVSQKGMQQIGLPTVRFEKAAPRPMPPDTARSLARTLNSILSRLIEAEPDFQLMHGRDVVFAEIGTQLQGTWVNMIGQGAAKKVEEILQTYIKRENRGVYHGRGRFELTNGWKITFAAEPDIEFTDSDGIVQIAVEIKGSLDVNGAQTRYGEAKKSFAKSLAKNPRCHTVYLASCFTESVEKQIKADGQVRETYNLTSIVRDPEQQERFLKRLFHFVDTPQ